MDGKHLCLLLVFCLSLCHAKEKCRKYFDELADGQSKFVLCAVRNSSPANSCEKCNNYYQNMTGAYTNLVSNKTCIKEFINRNRLNIVFNMQKYLLDVWNKGFCDNCFDGDKNETLSEETLRFQNLTGEFEKCLASPPEHTPCLCNPSYADLNNFYSQIDQKYKGRVCFDTQDKMNITRLHWSKDLNCCHREYSLSLFYVASSLFTALPIVFYFGMFFYTKHLERNHDTLDNGLDREHPSTSSSSSGGQSGRVAVASVEERPNTSNASSNFDDIDRLKAKRISTNRNADEPLIISTPHKVTSTNDAPRLIEL